MAGWKRFGWRSGCMALTLFLGMAASSRAQNSTPGSSPVSTPLATEPNAAAQTPSTAPTSLGAGANYTLGAEDVLDVDVFGLPELSKTVRVSNDGTVVLPLLGRVKAAGYTTEQLRRELETRYGQTYLQNPQVTLFIREFHSRPVSVMGAVDKPGVYQVTGSQTLIEILSQAGGFTRAGEPAGQSVFVTRKSGFAAGPYPAGMRLISPEKLEINLTRLFYSRDQTLNIPIEANDIITVNEADKFFVLGGVNHAAGFPFPSRDQVTVLQAVAMAGGLAVNASRGSARIIRTKEDGSRMEISIELGKIIKGKAKDLPLMANDILYINDSTTKAAFKRSMDAIVQTASGVTIYRSARP